MNYLGIDWGERRIGLAYADELGVAMPLPAAVARLKKERLAHIGSIIAERRIDEIICGYPINMDGSIGFKAKEVDAFIAELENQFKLKVHRVDERLSSHTVKQIAKAQKKQFDRRSGEIDSRSAVVILQDFIEAQALNSERLSLNKRKKS